MLLWVIPKLGPKTFLAPALWDLSSRDLRQDTPKGVPRPRPAYALQGTLPSVAPPSGISPLDAPVLLPA